MAKRMKWLLLIAAFFLLAACSAETEELPSVEEQMAAHGLAEVADETGTEEPEKETEALPEETQPAETEAVETEVSKNEEAVESAGEVAKASTEKETGEVTLEEISEPAECFIKGNSESKIYHEPGGASYDRTKNHVVYFCSTDEAEDAGYRAAKN